MYWLACRRRRTARSKNCCLIAGSPLHFNCYLVPSRHQRCQCVLPTRLRSAFGAGRSEPDGAGKKSLQPSRFLGQACRLRVVGTGAASLGWVTKTEIWVNEGIAHHFIKQCGRSASKSGYLLLLSLIHI